jgi:hypothetical protein
MEQTAATKACQGADNKCTNVDPINPSQVIRERVWPEKVDTKTKKQEEAKEVRPNVH